MYKKIKGILRKFDYYIYIDYSETFIGYIIIHEEEIKEILPKISKLHHYKQIKHKKQYITSVKRLIESNNIKSFLLKYKIRPMKDNTIVFTDVLEFVMKHDNCIILLSIDNNQYNVFIKLFNIIPHKEHVFVIKESDLRKDSVEYKLSLIIDNLLNVERIKSK